MKTIYEQHTTSRTIIVAISVAMGGIALVVVGSLISKVWLQAVLSSVGSLLFASIALTLIWDLTLKRTFQAEVMAIARLSEQIRLARLVALPQNFQRDID